MKASNSLWRERPLESVFPDLVREIEIYETEIELRKQGKLDEKLFAETRLRRGAYGQRYDNGQRWDGRPCPCGNRFVGALYQYHQRFPDRRHHCWCN